MVRHWIAVVSALVPRDERDRWREEWWGELAATRGGMTHAWGALADAWYLRTEGWTMDGGLRDLRIALRALARRPFFTGLAGVTLAIGIGANTAIFSVVDSVLLDPLPFPEADRLVSYNHTAPGLGVPLFPHSEGTYLHYQVSVRALEAFAVYAEEQVTLIEGGEPRQVSAALVTQRYFDVVGLSATLGRTFAEGEDRVGAEPVVIVSRGFWMDRLGADPEALGRLLEIDGVRRRLVGVVPDEAVSASEELWVPMGIDDTEPDPGSFGMIGVGRLAEESTVEAANTEMQELLLRFAALHPDDFGDEALAQIGLRANVVPLKELFVEDVREALWILLGTVGFVLLIACANVANLFLARAEGRQREQAVRTAMGAGRADLLRQYLGESLTLAAGGGLLGLGLAAAGVEALLRLAPVTLPAILDVGIDGSVLAFTVLISLLSGLAFGLLPLGRYGRPDLAAALKEGGRSSTTGRERHRARSALVVAQVALALVLLVGSGLMLRSFAALRSVDLGFDPGSALTFAVALPEAEYPEAVRTTDFYRRLEERMASLPGASGVGLIDGLPLSDRRSATPLEPVEAPFPDGVVGPLVELRSVSPRYFEVMRTDLLEGRPLTWDDDAEGFRGAVVSRSLAESFWPGRSALGRQLRSQGSQNEAWEIVGVVEDVRFEKVQTEAPRVLYLPIARGEPLRSVDVVVRAGSDPLGLVGAARTALGELDRRLPLMNPRTVDAVVRESLAATSFTVVLLGIAAGVALLLGSVGIYGVISYLVSRRTQEIGVRMALGARRATVLAGVVGEGLRLTGVGIALGLAGAWGLSRVLGSLLYGVSATDPLTFAGTALGLAAIASLASWIPARRASRVDPVEALRAE